MPQESQAATFIVLIQQAQVNDRHVWSKLTGHAYSVIEQRLPKPWNDFDTIRWRPEQGLQVLSDARIVIYDQYARR